jgi:hypothetical protein
MGLDDAAAEVAKVSGIEGIKAFRDELHRGRGSKFARQAYEQAIAAMREHNDSADAVLKIVAGLARYVT